MKTLHITAALLLLLGLPFADCRAADTSPQARYDAAKALLAKHSDSFWLDGTPEGRDALDE